MMLRIQLLNPGVLDGLRGEIAQALHEAAEETGEALVQEAFRIARARVLSRTQRPFFGTGRYFSSLGIASRKTPGQVQGVLSTRSAIGPIIEFGSRPHLIRPRARRALFWPGGPHPVKAVRHPGTPAYRVLSEAALQAGEQAEELYRKALNEKIIPR